MFCVLKDVEATNIIERKPNNSIKRMSVEKRGSKGTTLIIPGTFEGLLSKTEYLFAAFL